MQESSGRFPVNDVRMRGFTSRTSVAAAQGWVDRHAQPLEAESVPLAQLASRVLAEDVVSRVDVPGFDRAMMDGLAVQAADTQGAAPYNRLPLTVLGDAVPGGPFPHPIGRGQAVRIMTGAPLPAAADAVLPAELAEFAGDRVFALGEVPPGKHVALRGEDVPRDSVILRCGRRLRAQDVGLLSSVGCASSKVVRRPQVRIIATGNELLPAGSLPSGYKIGDANSPMLQALVERDGGTVIPSGIVPDDPDAILTAISESADVVLVSGGSSVGQQDHAPSLLAKHGELAIHGIAMRPSSPAGMGRLGKRLVFLLPGNPVSCLCAYDFFAGRAIRRLAGLPSDWPYRSIALRLSRNLPSVVGRVDYARVRIVGERVEPLAIGGASVLSSTTRADGFVVVREDSEGYPVGAEVVVWLYG
jgi:molybdopterin molybdotransferase